MASIDELFKRPLVNSNKRKAPPTESPDQLYKATKHAINGDAKGHAHPTVEDEAAETSDQDVEAGPDLPPDDANEDDEEDEEGRFFGGGVTQETADVLDYIEERESQHTGEAEKIDAAWLRRMALSFERRISKNAEMRAKYEDEPQKFMQSEADLDENIKTLSILSEHTELYRDFAKLGSVNSLVSLLAHENTDISINAIEILSELTDEDVEAAPEQWDALVDAMLDADLPDLLAQHFARLDENNEADINGVYHSLSLIENLASRTSALEQLVQDSALFKWLLARIQKKELSISQNKLYAAEVLAICLQSAEKNQTRLAELDAVETYLQLLSAYRKQDPHKDSDEEEYVENLFDGLVCIVDVSIGKQKFLEAEGVELCLIMLRQSKFSRSRALKVLDHAAGGQQGAATCEKLVEAAGLKPLFAAVMKSIDQAVTESLVGIFASMLRNLSGNSSARVRLLAKFVEKDYEKLRRIIDLRQDTSSKLHKVETQIAAERQSAAAEELESRHQEWLTRRLDAGLAIFQMADVILAWLVAEDDGARQTIVQRLEESKSTLKDIRTTLLEQLDGLKDDTGEEVETTTDILTTLVSFLQ